MASSAADDRAPFQFPDPDSEELAEDLAEAEEIAQETFGYDGLRPGQAEAIEAVLAGRDTLAVLPTGSGKSAIYQIPALQLDGPTVIVSPLIALQRDQVEGLEEAGVDAAQANSSIGVTKRRETFERFVDGDLEFLFLAPEQLAKDDVVDEVRAAGPSLFVVDEAHCISSWGHDFRPDYLRLGTVIENVGHPPVLALTATASPPVREEIVERLNMRDPTVVVRGFDRPNIHLSVETFHDPGDKRRALIERVAEAAKPGIVYAATRKTTEEVAGELEAHGIRAIAYHGGMAARARTQAQEAFMSGAFDVVVATTAFGMGIDKADVRFVYHHDVSDSVDSYYQEIGRAGRDGEPSEGVLFWRPEDLGLRRFFAGGAKVDPADLVALAVAVQEGDAPVEREALLEEADVELSDGKLTVALSRLEQTGAVEVLPTGEVVAGDEDVSPKQAAEQAVAHDEAHRRIEKSRVEMVRAYAEARSCRGRFILNYFGEDLEGDCGHCDQCDQQARSAGATGDAYGDPDADERSEDHPFDMGSRVAHAEWGEGLVVRYEGDTITVLFDEVGYKTLSLELVRERSLLQSA